VGSRPSMLSDRYRDRYRMTLADKETKRPTGQYANEMDHQKGLDLRDVLALLKSVKLGMGLLAAIAIASAVGTLIQQNAGAPQPAGDTYGVLDRLGLTALYHSWWFLSLLSLLVLNIAVCVFSRVGRLVRRPGMMMVHVSALFIAAGALIGAIWGAKGYVVLREGEQTDCFESRVRGVTERIPLGFTIGLDDFILERYGYVQVREHGADDIENVPAQEGYKGVVFDGRFSVEVLKIVPDFRMSIETGEITSASARFDNPAVQIRIGRNDDEEVRWVFARYPEAHPSPDALPLDAQFRLESSGRIKDFKSKLWIEQDGTKVLAKTIEVNDPLVYNGYHFYQSSYDDQTMSWTGLQVVKDPGVPVVYIGFAMLCLGTFIDLYPRSWRNPVRAGDRKER